MRILPTLLISLAVLAPQTAMASPATEALGNCLKDNTSGKDRKELARWVFLAISAHPEIRSLSTASDATRTESSKGMAALVTRLLADNCAAQTRAVVEKDGHQGMFNSFKALGEVAMMELMSNQEVSASVSAYTQFVDKKRLEAVLGK